MFEISLAFLIAILLGLATTGYVKERNAWNHGVCRHNGLPWQYFDTDSQGSRGYKAGKYTTWISWPIDKR